MSKTEERKFKSMNILQILSYTTTYKVLFSFFRDSTSSILIFMITSTSLTDLLLRQLINLLWRSQYLFKNNGNVCLIPFNNGYMITATNLFHISWHISKQKLYENLYFCIQETLNGFCMFSSSIHIFASDFFLAWLPLIDFLYPFFSNVFFFLNQGMAHKIQRIVKFQEVQRPIVSQLIWKVWLRSVLIKTQTFSSLIFNMSALGSQSFPEIWIPIFIHHITRQLPDQTKRIKLISGVEEFQNKLTF